MSEDLKPSGAETGAQKTETAPPPSTEATQKAQEGQQVAGELQTTVDAGNAADIDSAVKDFANELDSVDNHADLADSGQPRMVTEEVPDAGTDTADAQSPTAVQREALRAQSADMTMDEIIDAQDALDKKDAQDATGEPSPLLFPDSAQPGTMRTPDQVAQLTGNQPNSETPAADTTQNTEDGQPGTMRTPDQVAQLTGNQSNTETPSASNTENKTEDNPPLADATPEGVIAEAENATREATIETQDASNENATEATPPLAEATSGDVVTAAENITEEAAGETQDASNENKADGEKTPEQEAAELALGRDNLVKNLLKENPNLDLSTKEVQNYLKLAQENPQNMETLSAMTEKFMGAQAKESAEKLGLDPESFGKGSVDGIIDNIQKQFDELKKKIGESGGTEAQKAEADKKGWLMKLLKALAGVMGQVLIASGAAAKGAGETLTGKTDNKK